MSRLFADLGRADWTDFCQGQSTRESSTATNTIPTTTTDADLSTTISWKTSQPKETDAQSEGGTEEKSTPNEAPGESGGGDSKTRTIGLGVGLSLGISLAFGFVGYLAFLFWKRRRTNKEEGAEEQYPSQHQSPRMSSDADRWHSPGTFIASSENGDKRISELLGSTPSERESIQGRYELGSDMVPIPELPAGEWATHGKAS